MKELRKHKSRPCIYSVEDVAMVFEKLTASDVGYINYDEFCGVLGQERTFSRKIRIVAALIAKNILHYRQVSGFARDLIPYPTEPVLTATSAAHRIAMKLVLERFMSQK